MQKIPGTDLFKDVAHYFLRTPHGDVEVLADSERTIRCPKCGQFPQLIEMWTSERATFACVTEACPNFMCELRPRAMRLVYDENENFLGYEEVPELNEEETKLFLDASSKAKAEDAMKLLHDPRFKPAPLFPQIESMEKLFGLCEIHEDGSCSIELKE